MQKSSKEGKSLLEKIESIPSNYIYLILIAIILVPLFAPAYFRTPLSVSPLTRQSYATISSLKAGDYVLVGWDVQSTTWFELGPVMLDVFTQILKLGAKAVVVSFIYPEAPTLWSSLLMPDLEKQGLGSQIYGTQYVYLGFVTGGESAMAAFGNNMRVAQYDYQGRTVSTMPVMAGVTDIKSFKLLFAIGDTALQPYVRQFPARYNMTSTMAINAANLSLLLPYSNAGLIRGLINGIRGGAEYELLTQTPSGATAFLGSLTLIHIYVIILIVIGNLIYLLRKRAGEKEET